MSTDDFEKGIDLLLNKAYNAPTPSEKFRSDLFNELKSRQRKRVNARRSRIITLYSSLSAVAAVVVFTFIPSVGLFSTNEFDLPSDVLEVATAISAPEDSKSAIANTITTDKLIRQVSSTIPQSSPVVQLASYDNMLKPTSAHAVDTIDVFNPDTNKWSTVKSGENFTVSSGVKVRTPLGTVQSVNFSIDNGPSVMLDGMSSMSVVNDILKLEDGKAVVSLNNTNSPMKLQLADQKIILQPDSMAFATLDNDNAYAANGIPAPMLVLLKGKANTSDSHNTMLAEGRVYELFDTGTGRYPSRKVGSYENKREFMPMIDAIQAAYKSYK